MNAENISTLKSIKSQLDSSQKESTNENTGAKEYNKKRFRKLPKSRLFVYSGSVLLDKKIICNHYKTATIAISKAQATSNILYRFKRDHNLPVETDLYLGNYFKDNIPMDRPRRSRYMQPKLDLDFKTSKPQEASASAESTTVQNQVECNAQNSQEKHMV